MRSYFPKPTLEIVERNSSDHWRTRRSKCITSCLTAPTFILLYDNTEVWALKALKEPVVNITHHSLLSPATAGLKRDSTGINGLSFTDERVALLGLIHIREATSMFLCGRKVTKVVIHILLLCLKCWDLSLLTWMEFTSFFPHFFL